MRKTVDLVNQGANPDEVLEAIHGLMHAYRARQFQAAREAPGGVTHMEGKVLRFFARHPGATQSGLAAESGRDKGQLARLVGGLRERGLLEARADEEDRRNVRLHLTAAGQAADEALRRRGRRLAAVAVQGIDVPERLHLLATVARMRANLEGEAEGGS